MGSRAKKSQIKNFDDRREEKEIALLNSVSLKGVELIGIRKGGLRLRGKGWGCPKNWNVGWRNLLGRTHEVTRQEIPTR